MLNRPAIGVNPMVKERFLRALAGESKPLKKLRHFALRSPDNFLEALGNGLRLINERMPLTDIPETITLPEVLNLREAQYRQNRLSFQERMSLIKYGKEKEFSQAQKIKDVVVSLIEEIPFKTMNWSSEKTIEILARSMSALVFCEEIEKAELIGEIDKKIADICSPEDEIFCAFPGGPWGKMLAFSIKENRDRAIFKILASLNGRDNPVIVTQEEGVSAFASYQEQKTYFGAPEAREIETKINARRQNILFQMEEAWDDIIHYRSREISPAGWDKIFIPEKTRAREKTPLGQVGISFLRFIQEEIPPPAVGLEVELKNGKVLLGKINPQGALMGYWISEFPIIGWFVNYSAILFLRSLLVGGDGEIYDRYEEAILSDGAKKTREYLMPRSVSKYRYIRDSFAPTTNRVVRKIGQRRSPIRHRVKTHIRKLLPGRKANPEAAAILAEKGYNLTGLTWVGGRESFFFRGEGSDKDIVLKPIKIPSVIKQMSQALGI